MEVIELTLPWPPSLNHYYRHVGAKVLISARGRQYREDVGKLVLASGTRGLPLPGRLSLAVGVYPPDRRVRDLDNLLKGLMDSLQHAGVYLSDGQIDELVVRRLGIARGGLVTVSLGSLP